VRLRATPHPANMLDREQHVKWALTSAVLRQEIIADEQRIVAPMCVRPQPHRASWTWPQAPASSLSSVACATGPPHRLFVPATLTERPNGL
jgi:hypothetical protein